MSLAVFQEKSGGSTAELAEHFRGSRVFAEQSFSIREKRTGQLDISIMTSQQYVF